MPATIIYRKRKFYVSPDLSIREALNEIEVVPETIIPTRDGKLIQYNEILKDGDIIRLINVISGG